MSKYLVYDEVIKAISDGAVKQDGIHAWREYYNHVLNEAKTRIEQLPCVDAVKVVRCQNCLFGENKEHNVRCSKFYGMGGYDEFCSKGVDVVYE